MDSNKALSFYHRFTLFEVLPSHTDIKNLDKKLVTHFVQKQPFADVLIYVLRCSNKCSYKFGINRKTTVLEPLFNKIASLKACKFILKETPIQVLPYEHCENLRTAFFIEHLQWLLMSIFIFPFTSLFFTISSKFLHKTKVFWRLFLSAEFFTGLSESIVKPIWILSGQCSLFIHPKKT